MKGALPVLFTLLASASAVAQLNSPESVTWDPATNRYFVSNNGNNQILVRSSSGVYTTFTSNITSGPHGLEIVGNTLYACDGASVKGFDLTTAALVFNLNLGASFLNGICTDGVNNLFVTDFTARKVFRVNISQQTFTTFVPVQPKSPNGIIYDQAGGRIVWVTWGSNAPIMQALLSDSSVSQVTATTLGNCDGIVRDGAGNYYVSAWNTNAVWRFTSAFASPTQVVSGLNSPADIYYNLSTDTLASPNSGNNTVTFHYMGVQTGTAPMGFSSGLSITPNPVQGAGPVLLQWTYTGNLIIEVMDMQGRIVGEITEGFSNRAWLDTRFLRPGVYLVRVYAVEGQEVKKIVILNE
jgi:sugar lactone lactonase YvrE